MFLEKHNGMHERVGLETEQSHSSDGRATLKDGNYTTKGKHLATHLAEDALECQEELLSH